MIKFDEIEFNSSFAGIYIDIKYTYRFDRSYLIPTIGLDGLNMVPYFIKSYGYSLIFSTDNHTILIYKDVGFRHFEMSFKKNNYSVFDTIGLDGVE